MNILLQKFNTKYDTAPFSKIKTEDFLPAFKEAITIAKAEIDLIINNLEAASFENTISALSFSGETLERISSIFFNLHSAETNDAMQQIAIEVSPLLSEFGNDIRLNKKLFSRIKSVYEQKDNLNLTTEQATLLDKNYKNFSRNGASLDEDQKKKLREIDKDLSKLSLEFGENVLSETHAFELHITDQKDLLGLPEGAIESALELAKSKQKEGWIFTLDYPSYIPFITYAENRELRKKMTIAFGAKGFQNNDLDNQEIVLKIVKRRHERAIILGYNSHADFVLEERMAKNPEKVKTFLNDLLIKVKPAAKKEFDQLTKFAEKQDGLKQLEKWDGFYYSEKLKQKLFNLDDEKLRSYFQLEKVLNGAFTVANKLFGLTFTEIFDIDKYHEDIKTYSVKDENDNALVSVFYADFFPRKGKRNGAWMTSYKSQYTKVGKNERPHISIVCNFTKPTTTKPSLLTFKEVTTLFHEFGHALHGILANTIYPSLSGTKVYWDFVELPSQLLENWCYEPETLALFAQHYETGETIPIEYIKKIKESSNFQEGMATMRQLSFGLLDMGWHSEDPSNINNIKEFEKEQFASTQLYPDIKENAISTSFSHIFQGGYSSGYYSYKWAEVLDADAFEYFKEKGIFDRETATKFKENILSKGGTEHPMILYKRFRGQEPKSESLLKRAGLL